MFTVTEAHDGFAARTYTSHAMDACELTGWITFIRKDRGTVTEVSGTVAADDLATLDRTMAAAAMRRTVSAPVGAGYAVTYRPRVRPAVDIYA